MALVTGIMLLMVLTWTGLIEGSKLLAPSHSLAQQVQAIAEIAFGLFALVSIITTFRGRRWWPLAIAGLAISLTLATGLFAIVWNHMTLAGAILSAAIALAIALASAWLLQVGARGLTSA